MEDKPTKNGGHFVREHHRRIREENARDLERAEREGAASGKEPFDMRRLNELMGRDLDWGLSREQALREMYYISYPEIRTLAAFAEFRHEVEPWE